MTEWMDKLYLQNPKRHISSKQGCDHLGTATFNQIRIDATYVKSTFTNQPKLFVISRVECLTLHFKDCNNMTFTHLNACITTNMSEKKFTGRKHGRMLLGVLGHQSTELSSSSMKIADGVGLQRGSGLGP